MKRNIKKLPRDLKQAFAEAKETAKEKIARDWLDDAEADAPVWSGFAKSQGYAFIDGQVFDKSKTPTPDVARRESEKPDVDPGHDVTVAFHAGRPSEKHGTFYYTYYIGVINPGHLRAIHKKNWIEAALHPSGQTVQRALEKAFENTKLGNE